MSAVVPHSAARAASAFPFAPRGQRLVVIEAMKMEQALVAPFDGIVTELKALAGAQVFENFLLVRIEQGCEPKPA